MAAQKRPRVENRGQIYYFFTVNITKEIGEISDLKNRIRPNLCHTSDGMPLHTRSGNLITICRSSIMCFVLVRSKKKLAIECRFGSSIQFISYLESFATEIVSPADPER